MLDRHSPVFRLRDRLVEARLAGEDETPILASEPEDVRTDALALVSASMQLIEFHARTVLAAADRAEIVAGDTETVREARRQARSDALDRVPAKLKPKVERYARTLWAQRTE